MRFTLLVDATVNDVRDDQYELRVTFPYGSFAPEPEEMRRVLQDLRIFVEEQRGLNRRVRRLHEDLG